MVTDSDKAYGRYIEKILTDPRISQVNLDILKKYDSDGKLQQLSTGTRFVRLRIMKQLALFVTKDFKDMKKEDIEGFFSSLGDIQPKTWSTNGAYVKYFFKWFNNSDEYPHNVKWIKTSIKQKNHKLPSDLLTKDEIKSMAEATDNLMEKALIMVLYESACRIGELLNLRIKDLSSDQYGCIIMVDGKTGMRRIRLIESSPDLLLWFNNHPQKQDRVSLLFIHVVDNNKQYGKGLNRQSANYLLKKIARRAGIKKHVHPHLFRHSRLTELAKDFTESELKKYAGWTGSSSMAGIYVHLTDGDIEKKMLRNNGFSTKADDINKDTLKPKECSRCGELNPNTARFCYVCGMALDMKATAVESKELSQVDVISKGLIQFIVKNHPELVLTFLKENGMDRLI